MKNWQTTFAGIGAGALNLFAQGVNWKQILVSAGIAALGVLAQDGKAKTQEKADTAR